MYISKVRGQEKIYQNGPQIYWRLPITSTIDDSIVQIVRPDVKDVLHELLLIVPSDFWYCIFYIVGVRNILVTNRVVKNWYGIGVIRKQIARSEKKIVSSHENENDFYNKNMRKFLKKLINYILIFYQINIKFILIK